MDNVELRGRETINENILKKQKITYQQMPCKLTRLFPVPLK